MTDHQSNLDPLPEAVPMLSYERQIADPAMCWVVWYMGLWIVCTGAGALVRSLVSLVGMASFNQLFHMGLFPAMAMTLPAVSLAFGLGILRRRRAAFYGTLILTLLPPFIHMLAYRPAGLTVLAPVVASELVSAGLSFAAILSIFRRANEAGVLEPVAADSLERAAQGDSLQFLVSRIGWIIMSHGALLIQLAMWPILRMTGATTPSWDWSVSVYLSLQLAVVVCGLFMARGKRHAIWPAIGILPLLMVGAPVLSLWAYRGQFGAQLRPLIITQAVCGAISCAITIGLLIILARKMAQARETVTNT